MNSITAHSRVGRSKLIKTLISLLEGKFGDNFIALGAEGSYSRSEDKPYSDLELTVFLKNISGYENWEIRKIIRGQLLIVIPETRESYIQKYIEVTPVWHMSGYGTLLPLVNKPFIEEINNYTPHNVKEKCIEIVRGRWYHFQEITAKLLNSMEGNNATGVALTFYPFVKELLVLLAYINHTPYKTLITYTEQALQFKTLPDGFATLVDMFVTQKSVLQSKSLIVQVFESTERIVQELGVTVCEEELTEI